MKLDLLPDLGELDNNAAEAMLNLADGRVIRGAKLLIKSMYDFDFETPEGIERFVSLLPVMDAEIINDVMAEIWPGYPAEIDARRHRLEIRGYLKDYLEFKNAGQVEESDGDGLGAGLDGGGVEATGKGTQAPPQDAGSAAPEDGTPDQGVQNAGPGAAQVPPPAGGEEGANQVPTQDDNTV